MSPVRGAARATGATAREAAPAATGPTVVIVADSIVAESGVLTPGWVRIDGRSILDCGQGPPPAPATLRDSTLRLRGTIVPGFVDIHTHGAAGVDFADAATGSIQPAVDWHAGHGTTTIVASLATAPVAELERQLAALAEQTRLGVVRGIHLEGPWLSAAHRGAHAEALLRSPERSEVDRVLENGAVRMVTIAPELPGALATIRTLAEAGIVAAVGHTSCDTATAAAAFDAGARVATHLFNGMPPLHHREPGPVGVALLDDRVFVELILDGHHVAAEAAEIVLRLVGGRLVTVSDSIAATGCPDGDYLLAGGSITVHGGIARTADGRSLAGSTRTLGTAFRSLVEQHGLSLTEAVMATATAPADAMGLPDVGRIRPGAAADLVVLDGLEIAGVMKRGDWLRRPPGA